MELWAKPEDHLALITGASGGLGGSTALQLARKKIPIIAVGRNSEKLKRLQSQVHNLNSKCIVFEKDFERENAVKDFFIGLSSANLFPDIIINCLGGPLQLDDNLNIGNFRSIMKFNFEIAYEIATLSIPFMLKNNWGRFVTVGSVSGRTGSNSLSYAISKSSLETFTKFLGRKIATQNPNVVICGISPGAISVPGKYLNRIEKEDPKILTEWLKKHNVSSGRLAKVDEVANLILFLISDHSSYMHGSIVEIDGGTN